MLRRVVIVQGHSDPPATTSATHSPKSTQKVLQPLAARSMREQQMRRCVRGVCARKSPDAADLCLCLGSGTEYPVLDRPAIPVSSSKFRGKIGGCWSRDRATVTTIWLSDRQRLG